MTAMSRRPGLPLLLGFLWGLFSSAGSLDNGLGLTPPMGWNSWNHFGCRVSDELIRRTADAFISTGLAKAG